MSYATWKKMLSSTIIYDSKFCLLLGHSAQVKKNNQRAAGAGENNACILDSPI